MIGWIDLIEAIINDESGLWYVIDRPFDPEREVGNE